MTVLAKAEQVDDQFHIHIVYMIARRFDTTAIATTLYRGKLRVGISRLGILEITTFTQMTVPTRKRPRIILSK